MMDRRSRRDVKCLALALGLILAGASSTARAQSGGGKDNDNDKARAAGQPAAKAEAKKKAAPAPRVKGKGVAPSEDFQEGIRKTVERRRARRARRAGAMGVDGRPPGAIVPWPMPPALIIRQTPQVHDEIDSLLGQLRRGG